MHHTDEVMEVVYQEVTPVYVVSVSYDNGVQRVSYPYVLRYIVRTTQIPVHHPPHLKHGASSMKVETNELSEAGLNLGEGQRHS